MVERTETAGSIYSFAIIATLTVLLTGLGTGQQATSAQNTNDLNVSVEIGSKTIIDIQPKEFSWGRGSGILPGTQANSSDEANNYGQIMLENLGSNDIQQVWFNTTQPSQRPFGTGQAGNYDVGNFIALSNNGAAQFVNRAEFGIDRSGGAVNNGDDGILYVNAPDNWDYGRFRNTSQEYFWTVDDTVTDMGNSVFKIGYNPHNSTQTGSTDLSGDCDGGDNPVADGNACNSYSLSTVTSGGSTYAYTDLEVGAQDGTVVGTGLNNDGGQIYCAIMEESQVTGTDRPKVNFVQWNKGMPGTGTGDCAMATNMTIGTDGVQSEPGIYPGDWLTMDIKANIPYGVVSGELNQGSLFVYANS